MKNLQPNDDPVQVRRDRLRQWIEVHFNGEQVRFIADCATRDRHINQGELSGLLNKKSFGEKKARSLEDAAQMPFRYLDTKPGYEVGSVNVVAMEKGAPYKLPRMDKWTQEAVTILQTLTTEQKIACVVSLRAYKTAIGPVHVGQTLQVARKTEGGA